MMVMQIVTSRVAGSIEFDLSSSAVPEIEPNITLRVKNGIDLRIGKATNNQII